MLVLWGRFAVTGGYESVRVELAGRLRVLGEEAAEGGGQ